MIAPEVIDKNYKRFDSGGGDCMSPLKQKDGALSTSCFPAR